MDSNFNNQNNQPDYSQQPQQMDPQAQYQQQYYQQVQQPIPQQQAYYQQPQQAYYQAQPQYYQQPMMPQETKPIGKAVASMILSILSILLCCFFPYITLFTSIIGLILAIVSLKKKEGGKGMAIAGLVCGILSLVYSAVITTVLVIIFIQAEGDINEVYEILDDLRNL